MDGFVAARAVKAALFTVWMDAISSASMLFQAAREMVEGTGILEAPGSNSQRETGVADSSSVLSEPEACLLAKGETPVLARNGKGRFCDRLVNL